MIIHFINLSDFIRAASESKMPVFLDLYEAIDEGKTFHNGKYKTSVTRQLRLEASFEEESGIVRWCSVKGLDSKTPTNEIISDNRVLLVNMKRHLDEQNLFVVNGRITCEADDPCVPGIIDDSIALMPVTSEADDEEDHVGGREQPPSEVDPHEREPSEE